MPGQCRAIEDQSEMIQQVTTEDTVWLIDKCVAAFKSPTLKIDGQFDGIGSVCAAIKRREFYTFADLRSQAKLLDSPPWQ